MTDQSPGKRATADQKARRVAVVGSGGFLGSTLCPLLEAKGVTVFGHGRTSPLEKSLASKLRELTAVVWVATGITPARTEHAEADEASLKRMLAGLRSVGARPRLIFASSGGTVYDPSSPLPHTETSPTDPSTPYANAKLRQERLVLDEGGTVLRLANPFGPGQAGHREQGVVAHWMRAISEGNPVQIIGDPTDTRDYLFISDAAAAFAAAAINDGPIPPVLNVGSGQPTSLEDLLRLTIETTGEAPPKVQTVPRRSVDVSHNHLDISLITASLRWEPSVSLHDGLTATWRQVRQHE